MQGMIQFRLWFSLGLYGKASTVITKINYNSARGAESCGAGGGAGSCESGVELGHVQ